MINERMMELINEVSKGNKRAFSKLVGVTPTVIENIVGTRKGNLVMNFLKDSVRNREY